MDPQYERLSVAERLELFDGEHNRLRKRLLLGLITQDQYRQDMAALARRLGL